MGEFEGLGVKEMLAQPVHTRLADNVELVKRILVKNSDLIMREFTLGQGAGPPAVLFYIDGLSSNQLLDESVLRPLMQGIAMSRSTASVPGVRDPEDVRHNRMVVSEVKTADTIGRGIDGLLSGESLLFVDGLDRALLSGTKGWESRSPGDTASEIVIRGPRDGFTENIRTNTSLIRRRIKDPMFRLESLKVGQRSQTVVNVAYIEGIAKQSVIDEVMTRLQGIDVDGIMESGYIQELISDAPYSVFPTIRYTERPDAAAAAILEGRVVILTDSTPFALIVPTYFWDALMASDDYYSRYYIGTFSRTVRYLAFIVSLTLSSIYVMLVSFHQEMIPTQLALSVAAGRESVPFPVLVEMLVMEIAFELMREAGLRMPRPVGQAVSIVGSLIIGQAAVQAGLVSPLMVIVVAVTGISSFAIPSYETSFALRLLRFPIVIASGMFGLLGFVGALFVLVVHVLSLRSFGEPYMAPIIPFRADDQKDNLVRSPWWTMHKRPALSGQPGRQANDQRPGPQGAGSGGTEAKAPQPVRQSSGSGGGASGQSESPGDAGGSDEQAGASPRAPSARRVSGRSTGDGARRRVARRPRKMLRET